MGVDETPLFVSRAPDTDSKRRLVVPDGLVSRDKITVARVGGEIVLTDRGSKNPVRVNGIATTPTVLTPGDVIRCGDSVLLFDQAPRPEMVPVNAGVELLLQKMGLLASAERHRFARAAVAAARGGMSWFWTPGVVEAQELARWMARKRAQKLVTVRAGQRGVVGALGTADPRATVFVEGVDSASPDELASLLDALQARQTVLPSCTTLISASAIAGTQEHLLRALDVLGCHDWRLSGLEQRKADILLAIGTLAQLPAEVTWCDADTAESLVSYSWPRQLAELRRCAVRLQGISLPASVEALGMRLSTREFTRPKGEVNARAQIDRALRDAKGIVTEAARLLGLGRATLYRRLVAFGIDPNDPEYRSMPVSDRFQSRHKRPEAHANGEADGGDDV